MMGEPVGFHGTGETDPGGRECSLNTGKENTWWWLRQFGIMAAMKKAVSAMVESGVSLSDIAITCGIGCRGKCLTT